MGFAYDVTGDGKTALRGGFGMSYERNLGNVTYNASFNPPASAVVNTNCNANASGVVTTCPYFVTSDPLGPLGEPGPAQGLPPADLRDMDSNINVAQTQFWSMAVDRQLWPNALLNIYLAVRIAFIFTTLGISTWPAPARFIWAILW